MKQKQSDCGKNWDLLNDYADGRLAGKKLHIIESHLSSCMKCSEALRSIQGWSEIAAGETPGPSADFWERCNAKIAASQVVKNPARPQRRLVIGFSVASVAVALTIMFAFGPRQPDSQDDTLTNDFVMEHAAFAATQPFSMNSHHVLMSAKGAENRQRVADRNDSGSINNGSD